MLERLKNTFKPNKPKNNTELDTTIRVLEAKLASSGPEADPTETDYNDTKKILAILKKRREEND